MEKKSKSKSPTMIVGRYVGHCVDELPNSYLRWMITQSFPLDIMEAVEKKLHNSEYNSLYISISRHAIDMFSKRFLYKWLNSAHGGSMENIHGLGTFIAEIASDAWNKGEDVSKKRYSQDGVIKSWDEMWFVFGVNPSFPDFMELITVMKND